MLQVFTNSSSPQPTLDATDTAIAALADRLTINRVGWSLLIEIGANSRTPERSAQIANAVATAYMDYQQEVKHQANRTASTWLEERLRRLQEQTTSAERAVVDFKQQNAIVSADGKRIDEQNLVDLNKRLLKFSQQVIRGFGSFDSTRVHYSNLESKQRPSVDGSISDELARPNYLKLAPAVSGSVAKGDGVC